MAKSLKLRKWGALLKLEGYTTMESAHSLVRKFHEIVKGFKDSGIELDVFLFLEDGEDYPSQEPQAPKPLKRRSDRLP